MKTIVAHRAARWVASVPGPDGCGAQPAYGGSPGVGRARCQRAHLRGRGEDAAAERDAGLRVLAVAWWQSRAAHERVDRSAASDVLMSDVVGDSGGRTYAIESGEQAERSAAALIDDLRTSISSAMPRASRPTANIEDYGGDAESRPPRPCSARIPGRPAVMRLSYGVRSRSRRGRTVVHQSCRSAVNGSTRPAQRAGT